MYHAGVDIAIGCDIPDASGMSTSSAIICYMFLALARANDLFNNDLFKKHLPSMEELYAYLGFIENGQVSASGKESCALGVRGPYCVLPIRTAGVSLLATKVWGRLADPRTIRQSCRASQ